MPIRVPELVESMPIEILADQILKTQSKIGLEKYITFIAAYNGIANYVATIIPTRDWHYCNKL